METFQDCIKFANEFPICSLATMDGDQPRTRFVEMYVADDTGFYFHTEPEKAFYKQIKKNSKVEFCFIRYAHFTKEGRDPELPSEMRLTGRAEFIKDKAMSERILKDRPFLKRYGIETPDDPRLVVFRISHGEAYFWTGKYGCREAEIPRIKF